MWQDEMLIYPMVKRAVSVMARLTAWGYVLLALLWLGGLAVALASSLLWLPGQEPGAVVFCIVLSKVLRHVLAAMLLAGLYLLSMWCHNVLLAGRGLVVTRWLLLFLLPFALLYPVCVLYTALSGKLILANQFLLPAVLYPASVVFFVVNWPCMVAASLRLRVALILFGLCLVGQYVLGGSFLQLCLPCFSFVPLCRLARLAPLVVSLPPLPGEGRQAS